jgi:hypothetical protein
MELSGLLHAVFTKPDHTTAARCTLQELQGRKRLDGGAAIN